ncbi:MAG: acyl-CoA synthetase, partial [Ralstonia sp.]
KELIFRGVHNIYPLSIEAPLHRHPAVQIAAAVGRPDPHAGELPVAYVQLRAGETATEAELLAFLKAEIAERAALPRQVHIIDAMPLTAVGKIFKPALKHRETRDALSVALRDAGVAVSDLLVADERSRGLVVAVHLELPASDAAAREVLGRFPFPFTVD